MKRRILAITSLTIGLIAAIDIVKMLEGKTFTLQNSHTGFPEVPDAVEGLTLKTTDPVVSGNRIKIFFFPRKSLTIDPRERPVVIFVSETQLHLERRLSNSHKIVQTILINGC